MATLAQHVFASGVSSTASAAYASTSAGSTLVAVLSSEAASVTTPAGWTKRVSGAGLDLAIYDKINDGGGVTTVSFTLSGSATWNLSLQEWTGLGDSPTVQTATLSVTSSGTPSVGPITTTGATAAVAGLANNNGDTFSSPSGGFSITDQGQAGGTNSLVALTKASTAASYTAGASVTAGNSTWGVFATYQAVGTAYTSAGTGNWNNSATWSPSGIPVSGDTVTIANTHTVTVPAAYSAASGKNLPTTPTSAPTMTTAGSTTNLPTGTYILAVTNVNAQGETGIGFSEKTAISITNGSATNARVTLGSLPTGVTSRNIYLTAAGGASGSETLYCTGVTGSTLDLISSSWGNTVSGGAASGGALAQNAAAAIPTTAATSALVINSGGFLIVNGTYTAYGDIVASGAGTSIRDVVTVGADGILEGNGSTSTATYRLQLGTGQAQFVRLKCTGTSGHPATVRNSGTGCFWIDCGNLGSWVNTGFLNATYTNFTSLGSASQDALTIYYWATYTTADFTCSNCTWSGCGQITMAACNSSASTTCSWTNNTVKSSLGATFTWTGPAATGTNVFTGNYLDMKLSSTVANITLTGNYFGGNFSGSGVAASFQNNLINHTAGSSGSTNANDLTNCYVLMDSAATNPHPFGTASGRSCVYDGNIFDCPAFTLGDQGDMLFGNSGSGKTATVKNNLMIPGPDKYGPGVLCSPLSNAMNWDVYHNTVTGGDGGTAAAGTQDNVARYGESGNGFADMYTSVRDNILYVPSGMGVGTIFSRLSSVGAASNGVSPANAHHNACNAPRTTTTTGVTAVYGTGGGYVDYVSSPSNVMFSGGTPGSSDVMGTDPNFVDTTRNFATFDTAYLGNSATAWATATSYSVGDIVSAQSSGTYGNAVINYRCKTAHTSSAGNSATGIPGNSATTTWRTNWEYASHERFRAAAAGVTYTPGTPQATVQDLTTWIKAGFAPRATAYQAASDSVSPSNGWIGAVQGSAGTAGVSRVFTGFGFARHDM